MQALNLAPAFSILSAWGSAPLRPLHTWVRTTEERFRPARLAPHHPGSVRGRAAPAGGPNGATDEATVLREPGVGKVPTVVLGGLVPNSTEQVFLLRRFLRKQGDVYYVQYPPDGFSLDRLCEQLSELVDELAAKGSAPALLAVSFGAGIVLEWLRRRRAASRVPALSGVVLISPVACVDDLMPPGAAKPTTLVGRALQPFLQSPGAPSPAAIEKSRSVFLRMFEAGAQNKAALRLLMTTGEAQRLRTAVLDTLRAVSARGAHGRVRALASMCSPIDYFRADLLPLSSAPTLILFAEREDMVLDPTAPVRLALERAAAAYFPAAHVRRVAARPGGTPVQHASLVFHAFEFLRPLRAFYRRIRRSSLALAA